MSNIVMPWGKYKGKHLVDLPSSYLKWLAENSRDERICCTADREWNFRETWDSHHEDEPT